MNILFINSFVIFIISIFAGTMPMTVTSTAFKEDQPIPAKYTCQGININPDLMLDELPPKVKTLAVIMDDPDAPNGNFDHWVVFNIPPSKRIAEKSVVGIEGKNGTGKNGYHGPCPPTGKHHYHFKVYALDIFLPLKAGADKTSVEKAMQGHIVGYGELMGTYQKTK